MEIHFSLYKRLYRNTLCKRGFRMKLPSHRPANFGLKQMLLDATLQSGTLPLLFFIRL